MPRRQSSRGTMTREGDQDDNGSEYAGKAIAVGISMAALATAAYLLYGPKGKENRRRLKGWAERMRDGAQDTWESTRKVASPVYDTIVSELSRRYENLKDLTPRDIEAAIKEMQNNNGSSQSRSSNRAGRSGQGGRRNRGRKSGGQEGGRERGTGT